MIKRIDNTANAWKIILTLMVIYIHSFSLVPAGEGTLLYYIKVFLALFFPELQSPCFLFILGTSSLKGRNMVLGYG